MNRTWPNGKCLPNLRLSRRNFLGVGFGIAALPQARATKPALVLALDATVFWYLGDMASELMSPSGLHRSLGIASLRQGDAVVVVMDLACPNSHALLSSVTQRIQGRDTKVYGVGLAPFEFEGEARDKDARQGCRELNRQTNRHQVVRSDAVVAALGDAVTWAEAQRHLMGIIQKAVADLLRIL